MNQPSQQFVRAALLAIICSFASSLLAATVSGTVTDRTTGKPAAGDTVTLLAMTQNLQEIAHTATDAQGRYTFQVPAGPQLIRVDHHKVGYYAAVAPGATIADVAVYDTFPSAPGLRVEAHVLHIEADARTARVIESCIVQNGAPRTQLSPGGFDFVLPREAKLAGASATDASQMTESLLPVDRHNGRWSLVYPIRPGATELEIAYSLPWSAAVSGSGFSFHIIPALPTDNVAVLLPAGMHFTGPAFHAVNENSGYQTFLDTKAAVGKTVDFSVAGTGSMPAPAQDQQQNPDQVQRQDQASSENQAAPDGPGGGLGAPIATPDPLYRNKWIILTGLGLLFTVAAAFLLRRRPVVPVAALLPAKPSSLPQGLEDIHFMHAPLSQETDSPSSALLRGLREEMSLLEADRAQGSITAAEYEEVKAALDLLLARALSPDHESDLIAK